MKLSVINTKTGYVLSVIAAIVLVLATIAGIATFTRYMSNITVIETLYSPRPGVECMKWVTSDGIAAQCWKNTDLPAYKIK